MRLRTKEVGTPAPAFLARTGRWASASAPSRTLLFLSLTLGISLLLVNVTGASASPRYYLDVSPARGNMTCAAVKYKTAELVVASIDVQEIDDPPVKMHYKLFKWSQRHQWYERGRGFLNLHITFRRGGEILVMSYERPWSAKRTSKRTWLRWCR